MSSAWLWSRQDRYPYRAEPVPTSVRPEAVEAQIGQCVSAVLEPGWRTYAFATQEALEKFNALYLQREDFDGSR